MLRIGFLTSGGDCQALNAAMRGVFKCVCNNAKEPVEFYGFEDGYKGLIYGKFHMLTGQDFKGILTRGGTILGTSRVPFKTIREPDENGLDKVEAMKQTYHKLQLDCLVMGGGNGSTKTANLLSQEGLNVVTLPKTIDNDLYGTDMTFGFQSAVDIATKCIDDIHTTASSHGRVFIVEIMGHKVGWLPLNAGIAGGISKEDAKLSKKEYKKKLANYKYPSVSYEVADAITKATGREVRVTVPGHTQRGGAPDPYDRVFATRLGAEAGKLILKKEFGYMVAYKNREIVKAPLSEVAGKLKTVDPKSSIIKEAKWVGISFGD